MDIFYILNNLYTNKSSKWILELDDKELQENNIEPFLLQRWLCLNDNVRQQVRWLDKYTFNISSKMFISLAWSVLPKYNKAPFVTWIKKKTKEEEYSFILPKIRQHLQLGGNDYKAMKTRIIKLIETDRLNWFGFYGIPKGYWKQYNLNFDKIKEIGEDKKQTTISTGLDRWGIN